MWNVYNSLESPMKYTLIRLYIGYKIAKLSITKYLPVDEDDNCADKQHPGCEQVPELTSRCFVTLQWIQLLLCDLDLVSFGDFTDDDLGFFEFASVDKPPRGFGQQPCKKFKHIVKGLDVHDLFKTTLIFTGWIALFKDAYRKLTRTFNSIP